MNMDVDRTELTDVEYVKLAIEEGDMLGPRPNSEPPTAERRALIVRPRSSTSIAGSKEIFK